MRLRFALMASVSLLALTIAAPPKLEELGRAVYGAGVELGFIEAPQRSGSLGRKAEALRLERQT